MFELQTERLRLLCLNLENLRLLIEDRQKLEKNLGLKITDETLDEHVKKAMGISLKYAMEDEKNYPWYTNWQIVLK